MERPVCPSTAARSRPERRGAGPPSSGGRPPRALPRCQELSEGFAHRSQTPREAEGRPWSLCVVSRALSLWPHRHGAACGRAGHAAPTVAAGEGPSGDAGSFLSTSARSRFLTPVGPAHPRDKNVASPPWLTLVASPVT